MWIIFGSLARISSKDRLVATLFLNIIPTFYCFARFLMSFTSLSKEIGVRGDRAFLLFSRTNGLANRKAKLTLLSLQILSSKSSLYLSTASMLASLSALSCSSCRLSSSFYFIDSSKFLLMSMNS